MKEILTCTANAIMSPVKPGKGNGLQKRWPRLMAERNFICETTRGLDAGSLKPSCFQTTDCGLKGYNKVDGKEQLVFHTKIRIKRVYSNEKISRKHRK